MIKMKLGIMQPYFLPYIGYWQLLNLVDEYVIYDDVNFIKGGWINRNRILIDNNVKYFNVPMIGASPNKLINQVGVNNSIELKNKNMRIIENAYKKAPLFNEVYPIISSIIYYDTDNLSDYLINSIKTICSYFDINTKLIISSELNKNCFLKGQDKVLHICNLLNASEYYNSIGGQELYSFSAFEKNNVQLKFLKTGIIAYNQFNKDFQSNLSILDVMMFNSKDKICSNFFNDYSIITE